MKNIKTTAIKIITPKKFMFNGLYFGEPGAKNILVYLHGLSGTMFSHIELFRKIVSKDTAVLSFSNRGSGLVSWVRQLDRTAPRGFRKVLAGMAHEVFTDCVDDIEGAIKTAKELGCKNIYLLGHSTGCQKSVYYLAKKPQAKVKGAILMAPTSDFADIIANTEKKIYNRAVAYARKMCAEGRAHDLLPKNIWPEMVDAQRFLSLFTPESSEEIFTYASDQKPRLMQRVKRPLLAVLAEQDEYMERPIESLAGWFSDSLKKQAHSLAVIKGARHDFGNNLDDTAKAISNWIK
jgi:alpha-beta hydrolase superfamily lysophospholipase